MSGGVSASATRRAGAGQLRKFPACLETGFARTHRRFSNFPDRVLEGNEQETVSATCSLGGAEASCDDRVEEASEEVEPLALLDLAITVGVEAVEELLDLGFLCGLVAVGGEAVASELHNLGSVNLAVAVNVELSESFLSL